MEKNKIKNEFKLIRGKFWIAFLVFVVAIVFIDLICVILGHILIDMKAGSTLEVLLLVFVNLGFTFFFYICVTDKNVPVVIKILMVAYSLKISLGRLALTAGYQRPEMFPSFISTKPIKIAILP